MKSFTEDEDYDINKYDSLGFINTQKLKYLLKSRTDFEMYLIILILIN